MASDNNGLFLRTVAACAVFMTCLLGALLYNASVREMQRLHDEVAALRSDVLDLRQKLNAWSENTAGRHYQGNEARSSDNDGDDDEWDNDIDNSDDKNDDDNDDDDVNPDSNRKDYERGDLLSKILHHRSRRQTETRKKPKRKFRTQAVVLQAKVGVQNPLGIITHWEYADWADKATKRSFSLGLKQQEQGKVTIKKEGLYFILVQITFNGNSHQEFAIMKENKYGNVTEEISCCINVPKHPDPDDEQNNYILRTCHTSKLVLVDKKDKIYVINKIEGRAIHFEPGYTFIGMFKLR